MSPFTQDKRRAMSPQRIARIFARCGGVCGWVKAGKKEGCGRKLGAADRYRVEHGDALENGGADVDDNCGLSCKWCWPAKDAEDHAEHGHDRRTFTNHVVPKEYRRSRSWRR